MELSISSKIKLNNEVEIPILGLGTWQSEEGKSAENAVYWGLKHGYIHIDTALIYGNEKSVGKALKKYLKETGKSRDEIFITTKLWNSDHKYDDAMKAIRISLRNLQLDYVDLYLIHWPEPRYRLEAWKALEKINKEGKARAIGVSNYMLHHLEELLPNTDIIPQVNQVEFSPYLYLKDLHEFCNKNSIKLEAYSPLTHAKKLDDPKLVDTAHKYNKTSAQILIRWGLQKGVIEIPKSTKEHRIIENADVFDFQIDESDMKLLDSFDEQFRAGPSPEWHPTHERWR